MQIETVADGEWAFKLTSAAFKAGKSTWFKVSEKFAEYAQCVLPPIYFVGGFAVGEPSNCDERGVDTYVAVVRVNGTPYARELARDKMATEAQSLRDALTTPAVQS